MESDRRPCGRFRRARRPRGCRVARRNAAGDGVPGLRAAHPGGGPGLPAVRAGGPRQRHRPPGMANAASQALPVRPEHAVPGDARGGTGARLGDPAIVCRSGIRARDLRSVWPAGNRLPGDAMQRLGRAPVAKSSPTTAGRSRRVAVSAIRTRCGSQMRDITLPASSLGIAPPWQAPVWLVRPGETYRVTPGHPLRLLRCVEGQGNVTCVWMFLLSR